MKKRTLSLTLAFVLTLALVPALTTTAQAAQPWQDAYAEFLMTQHASFSFALYDIDKNSTPELLISTNRTGDWIVYNYANNSVQELYKAGGGAGTGDVRDMLAPNNPNFVGLFFDTIPTGRYYISIENNKMVVLSESEGQRINNNEYQNSTRLATYPITATNIQMYIGTTANATPHPYATALREFFKDANGKTYACLVDINGDGAKEMFAIKENAKHSANPVTKCFFYIKNGVIQKYQEVGGYEGTGIFLSSTNHLVTYMMDSPTWRVFSLTEGELKLSTVELIDDFGEGFYYNGKKITETQYSEYCKQYGLEYSFNSNIWVSPYVWNVTLPDQTAEILKMTAAPSGKTATPTASTVFLNGKATAFDSYTIDGNNYFKLRDLAKALSGSVKQFEVGYNNSTKAITLTSGKVYTSVGGEMAAGDGKAKTATPTASKIYLDGRELNLTVYTINGNNFFKLRDLMKAIDVYVGYDNATKNITLDTSKGYVEP